MFFLKNAQICTLFYWFAKGQICNCKPFISARKDVLVTAPYLFDLRGAMPVGFPVLAVILVSRKCYALSFVFYCLKPKNLPR